MKTIFLITALLCGSLSSINTDTGKIQGHITDSNTGEAIPFANITASQNGTFIKGTTSDVNGYFDLGLPIGKYEVNIAYIGYDSHETKKVSVEKDKVTKLDIKLKPAVIELHSIEVKMVKSKEPSYRSNINSVSGGATYDVPYVDYNTESYDVINDNNFKEVIGNPLSTFSVDVDRASYSNVRRFLSQSQKPPVDAVRIEEMINYFDYDYPQPKDGHPFSVTMEAGKCPWNDKNQLVLIGIKGENINEEKIPANNLVFLIDVSGSMNSPNRLPLVIQSFKLLVEQLRPQDRVAIVVYAGAAGLVLESTPGNQKDKIIASLERLTAGGSTAGSAGINLAYKVAKENFIPNGNNRVILASDGDFNVGTSSNAELVRLIEGKRDEGIFLSVLGFGMGNYKDSRFEQLSNAGNGNYFYIDNILEARKVFVVELWGTLYTIAKDVKIQVEFNPSKVKAYRLIGYENRLLNAEDFNNDKKDAGDIGCGHTVTALYEIIPAGSSEDVNSVDPLKFQSFSTNASKDFMHVKIRYKKPKEDTSILIEKTVRYEQLKATSNIWFASAVAEFGMLLRNSEFKGNSSFNELMKRASEYKGTDEFGFRADFIKLTQMAELLYK